MKYAIMSDVHANPAAREAALKDAHALGCGHTHTATFWTLSATEICAEKNSLTIRR